MVTLANHFFIAGALAFLKQPRADPPHKRMEPKYGFDNHVQAREEIVAAAHVTQFVHKDCVHFRGRESFQDSLRQQQNRPDQPNNSRLQ